MEMQSGQKFRQVRKGGSKPPSAPSSPETVADGALEADGGEDSAGGQLSSRINVTEARSHLNIAGTTHAFTGCSWCKKQEGDTDGRMARFNLVVVEAEYTNLPDRKVDTSYILHLVPGKVGVDTSYTLHLTSCSRKG